ncbi:DUF1878 family protein [Bacillus sp. KH172YL63]|uniref:DUF1878 family protein n=1 Tax=Bacillus sp. KH172YL63 TaxID=2709784 RepID=UPI0013E4C127|nr:DUF1878 family protein [Bacillus sp. KH172YL63]BCB02929.1 hypothetical protein KH172YL63_10620 [Bacillus sp. KH172YL63]
MDEVLKRLEKLEYYQRLMAEMIPDEGYPFHRLIIQGGLSEEEVQAFLLLCDRLSKKFEKQKAEGFVYHTPLFKEFKNELHPKLEVKEVVESCLAQELYPALMYHFKKSL